jgi:nucleoside triphosphate pyrophosphatase
MRLILASASPRRAELLTKSGFTFDVVPAHVDETVRPGEQPRDYALRVAHVKATEVAQRPQPAGSAIVAADTVVVAGGRILGKPVNEADAASMLKLLSGTVHDVLTAVVLHVNGRELSDVVTTRVHLTRLTDAEIAWYVASGEPDGKAGAYAIQGLAARFVDWIEGSWANVVGLPVATVYRMLNEAAVIL